MKPGQDTMKKRPLRSQTGAASMKSSSPAGKASTVVDPGNGDSAEYRKGARDLVVRYFRNQDAFEKERAKLRKAGGVKSPGKSKASTGKVI